MTNLFRHIEFLLLRHDCVIVPGLGAFIVTATPARIDNDSRRIFPPYRSVMFNQAVVLDDGLLANSYARSLSLTFEEARQIVLKDVANLHANLRANKEVEFGRLGKLTLGEEGQLQFSPSATPEALSELIGLSSIALPDFNKIAQQKAIREAKAKKEETPYYHFKINRTVIKFAAVFAVLFALALAVIMYPVPHDSREQRASVVPVEVLIPTAKQETIVNKPVAIESNVPIEKKALSQPVESTETPNLSYHMIVATFHSKKEAERYATAHSTVEYPLEAISSRKLTRVSAASSDNKEELIKKLNTPEVTKRFPHAWIWTSAD